MINECIFIRIVKVQVNVLYTEQKVLTLFILEHDNLIFIVYWKKLDLYCSIYLLKITELCCLHKVVENFLIKIVYTVLKFIYKYDIIQKLLICINHIIFSTNCIIKQQ